MVGTFCGPFLPRVLYWEYREPALLVPHYSGGSWSRTALEKCVLKGAGSEASCPGRPWANHANHQPTFNNKRLVYALNIFY